MGVHNLDKIFRPDAIAVIGAGERPGSIGAELLKRCLSIAQERGIEKVVGTVLAENIQMLSLGRKLGFEITRVPGSSEYELNIDFTKSE